MRHIVIASALCAALSSSVSAEELMGIARVIDGDTIAIDNTKVRLEGIDAPEAGQTCKTAQGTDWPCGQVALEFMIALVHRQPTTCVIIGVDRYQRKLGTCTRNGADRSVNDLIVAAGLARAFVRYSSTYVAQEDDARAAKAGIWQGAHQAPWDYRAERREAIASARRAQ